MSKYFFEDESVNPTRNSHLIQKDSNTVKGEFSSEGSTWSYEFGPRGYSRVLYKKNGKVLFDGTAQEFQKFRQKKNIKKGFDDGRNRAKEDFSDCDLNIETTSTKGKPLSCCGCSFGCLVFLFLGAVVIAALGAVCFFFGESIFNFLRGL